MKNPTIMHPGKVIPNTVDRMCQLHNTIQGGTLRKIKLKQDPIFSQLDISGQLVIQELQNTLFLSRKPLTHSDENKHILKFGRTGKDNTDILLKGGFSRSNRKGSTLDFFLLCESLFEEVPQEEIDAYDGTNKRMVDILNES